MGNVYGQQTLTVTTQQIYKGLNEIRLSKLVTEPSHSILTQSYDSRLRLVGLSAPVSTYGQNPSKISVKIR